jgi:hypothetical protein
MAIVLNGAPAVTIVVLTIIVLILGAVTLTRVVARGARRVWRSTIRKA